MELEKKLIIIRGVSGSGKSTYAQKKFTGLPHYEADQFFSLEGEYKFNPSKLKEAHTWCQSQVRASLEKGKSVVVSNTFTRKWEVEPYLKMAQETGAEVVIYRMMTQFKNVHNVPQSVVDEMKERFEDIEGEIKVF